MEAFPHFIQCRAPFECSPALFPSGVSEGRLTYDRHAAVGWQNDHVRKYTPFGAMVSGLRYPGTSPPPGKRPLVGQTV